jgi:hypothetical protein
MQQNKVKLNVPNNILKYTAQAFIDDPIESGYCELKHHNICTNQAITSSSHFLDLSFRNSTQYPEFNTT